MSNYKSLALALTLMVTSAFANQGSLKDGHPDHYVVKKGDTLWDISALFLNSPWMWPEIWYVNPQVSNPHLIYPGDELTLVYVDGKPQLRINRRGQRGGIKLSPRARVDLYAVRHQPALPALQPYATVGQGNEGYSELPYYYRHKSSMTI